MQFLILGWLVLELTGSASQLGFVIFIYGIPNMAMLVFGGVFADRFDRRFLLIFSQTFVSMLILLAAVLAGVQLISIWHIYGITFLIGVIQGINMPARMAIIPSLVNKEDLMNATALNMTVMNSGRIAGPAVAGWVIEVAGIGNALYFNAICYAFGVVFLVMISGLPPQPKSPRRNIVSDFAEGVGFLFKTPAAYTVIGIGFAFGFFAAAHVQVLPAFAKEVLSASASGAGLLISAAGFGSLFASLLIASAGNVRYKGFLLLGSAIIFGVSLLLFAWSPIFSVSWLILLVVGAGFNSYISFGTIILQLSVPPALLGRLMSLWLISAALSFVGALPLGVIADNLGWPISISYGAIMFLIVVMILGVWMPTLRRMRL